MNILVEKVVKEMRFFILNYLISQKYMYMYIYKKNNINITYRIIHVLQLMK